MAARTVHMRNGLCAGRGGGPRPARAFMNMFAFAIAPLARAFMNTHVHELFMNVFVCVALARTGAFMNRAVHERVRKRLFTSVTS